MSFRLIIMASTFIVGRSGQEFCAFLSSRLSHGILGDAPHILFLEMRHDAARCCEELQIYNLYDNTLSKERKERKALKTAQVLASLYKFNLLVYTTLPTSKASLIHNIVGCWGFHGIIEPQYIIRIKISLCSIEFQPCHVMCHIRVIDATLFLTAVYF